ncbi:hypothetical protein O181_003148 [Austropuccinia psidii MF-1]|uniref:Uncharacterized protein n=1 Tax=Austropuccinia psidii MF-1 TaxID=1389203 RepID=A0A9Q3GDA3_9BASI|nr:hypothetical protein [Austropuccinia psidii MF-1]
MSPVHLRNLDNPRNHPEDREELSRVRRPGHLGHHSRWQDTEGLEGHGSSYSAPPTPQRFIPIQHGQQEEITTPGGEDNQDRGRQSHYKSYRRTIEPDRAYSDSFRITRSRPTKLSSDFAQFRQQQMSGQDSPLFTIPGSLQEKTRLQREKQDLFQQQAERVKPNNPEAVGLGERSTQEPEIDLNTSRISITSHRNITPTQNEHNVVTP